MTYNHAVARNAKVRSVSGGRSDNHFHKARWLSRRLALLPIGLLMLRRLHWTSLLVMVVTAATIAPAACGRHRPLDATYRVTKVEGRMLCLELVKGDGDHRLCDQFPRVEGSGPIKVGDCVLLRLSPESSGQSRLILKPPTVCR